MGCSPFAWTWIRQYSPDVGSVSEPYYSQDDKGECTIKSSYRSRAVQFDRVESLQIVLRTYWSETQQWYRPVLGGSRYRWHTLLLPTMGSCFATTESIFLLTIPSVLTYPHSLIAPINSTNFFVVFNCILIGGVSGLSADDAIGAIGMSWQC